MISRSAAEGVGENRGVRVAVGEGVGVAVAGGGTGVEEGGIGVAVGSLIVGELAGEFAEREKKPAPRKSTSRRADTQTMMTAPERKLRIANKAGASIGACSRKGRGSKPPGRLSQDQYTIPILFSHDLHRLDQQGVTAGILPYP